MKHALNILAIIGILSLIGVTAAQNITLTEDELLNIIDISKAAGVSTATGVITKTMYDTRIIDYGKFFSTINSCNTDIKWFNAMIEERFNASMVAKLRMTEFNF